VTTATGTRVARICCRTPERVRSIIATAQAKRQSASNLPRVRVGLAGDENQILASTWNLKTSFAASMIVTLEPRNAAQDRTFASLRGMCPTPPIPKASLAWRESHECPRFWIGPQAGGLPLRFGCPSSAHGGLNVTDEAGFKTKAPGGSGTGVGSRWRISVAGGHRIGERRGRGPTTKGRRNESRHHAQ
jgi:hypothetical protein